MKIRVVSSSFCILVAILSPLFPASAAGFNPNFVLSDRDLVNYQSLTKDEIQNFLNTKPGTLASYKTADLDGALKSASEIIWRVSNVFLVSPKFLLGMLQKEQSLVTDSSPKPSQYDWAMGYAVCDGCSVSDSAVAKFKGFAKQIDSAAQQFRIGYLADLDSKGKTITNIAPGSPVVIDNTTVIPENKATAALYTYTPHLEGNRNLWRIWQDWFARMNYPNGSILKNKKTGEYWRISSGKRQLFPSAAVLSSYVDPSAAIEVEENVITAFDMTEVLSFPNYALVEDEKGDVYLLVGFRKRRFQTLDDLKLFGFSNDEIIKGTTRDLEKYADGDTITYKTEYPRGFIVEDKLTKKKYLIEENKRREIPTSDLLQFKYRGWKISQRAHAEVAAYPEGATVQYPDGSLLKLSDGPIVYVIADGKRRPILDEQTFLGLGYKWSSIRTVSREAIEIHQPGDSLIQH